MYSTKIIIDRNWNYKDIVVVNESEDKESPEYVKNYTLNNGERLINAAKPKKRQHAGDYGFVKPRWDKDTATWIEGATAEELSAWETEHPDLVSLETKRATKHSEISAANELAIYAGVDVETTNGIEHFSLTEKDQLNLGAAKNAIDCGATEYLYHADGKVYRLFTSDEIRKIVQAAVAHITRCNVYCNHLFAWINISNSDELESIVYGSPLPETLSNNMNELLNS